MRILVKNEFTHRDDDDANELYSERQGNYDIRLFLRDKEGNELEETTDVLLGNRAICLATDLQIEELYDDFYDELANDWDFIDDDRYTNDLPKF